MEVCQENRINGTERDFHLVQPHCRSATNIEQQLLTSDLNQRSGAEPVDHRVWNSRPQQRHFEILSGYRQ
jgi:hypothetical protein